MPTFLQGTKNIGVIGNSIGAIAEGYEFLFFIDLLLMIVLVVFKIVKVDVKGLSRRKALAIISLALGLSSLNLALAETDRPQLLTRGFDRNYIVKYLGMYNYTIYDAVQSTKASAQRVLADSSDIIEVINLQGQTMRSPIRNISVSPRE